MVEGDVSNRPPASPYANAGPPHPQGRDRGRFPLSEVEDEEIKKRGRWMLVPIDDLDFLPVLAQGKLELPRLLALFDSVPERNPRMGKIVRDRIVVRGDQQFPGQRIPGERGQAEIGIDGELDLMLEFR
jgi:hypothetical protein